MPRADAPASLLATDLYQLTMAAGYWRAGLAEREATFHLTFRHAPFGNAYAIASGVEAALHHATHLALAPGDREYLASLPGNDGRPLFDAAFLDWLGSRCVAGPRGLPGLSVDAVPEGTLVLPHEPLLRVTGPLALCQLLETPLLNRVNFASLVATKAARICEAARWSPVLEFGLRRAQGPDGGLTASRAAYVGGCTGTSNVLAGRHVGMPVKGTHAHAWVMVFEDELEAFSTYADVMPNNGIFLADTYETLRGVDHAIEAGRRLHAAGHRFAGVRLDSGDLDALARAARSRLDEAGFPDTAIVASGDLDEHAIDALVRGGAPIDLWGVGTRLATGWDEPALSGVYKLSAIRDAPDASGRPGAWCDRAKHSNSPDKASLPGHLQIQRLRDADGRLRADVIHALGDAPAGGDPLVDADDATTRRPRPEAASSEALLRPAVRDGERVDAPVSPSEARERALSELGRLPADARALRNPESVPVGLEAGLEARRRAVLARHGVASRTPEASPSAGT